MMSSEAPDGEWRPALPNASAAAHASHVAAEAGVDERAAGPSFARGLWRIAAADVSSGNVVRLLRDGPATYDAMMQLIDGARETVALESYMFRDDEVGQRFAAALTAAARRGVVVRLLVDWLGIRGASRAFFRRLAAQGIAVRVFNPVGFKPWLGIYPRDHRKLLVVDDRAGITGGVGIACEWGICESRRRKPWRDTAVCISGPAGSDMARAFEPMWIRALRRERRGAHRLLARPARGTNLAPTTAPPALVGIVEGEPFRLRVARALQMQSVSALRSIWIASAYFVPSSFELEALIGAARDGVDVRVLVPSRSDHPWTMMLTRRFYRRLLMNGVRVWEWAGEMMHAKTSVVDGRWVRVGSTDFNPLGVSFNYELDAVIDDPTVGAEAEAMFLGDLDSSKEVKL